MFTVISIVMQITMAICDAIELQGHCLGLGKFIGLPYIVLDCD